MAKEKHENKAKEKEDLIAFARRHHMFYDTVLPENYIAQGAEQRVYMKDDQTVLKLNDAIYYASW